MQIYEAAYQVLRELGKPTHLRNLVNAIIERKLFPFGAQQPERALGVAIDRHSEGVLISRPAEPKLFYRASPATYGLLEWLDERGKDDVALEQSVVEAGEAGLDSELFVERELHDWLFKNLEQNGLEALGHGRLSLFDVERQRGRSGKFSTGVVGEVDLLLRTPTGDFVVVELKRDASDKTVGQICRYWGYVKKELAGDRDVHGLIIARTLNEQLKYALVAVNQDIKARVLSMDISLGPPIR